SFCQVWHREALMSATAESLISVELPMGFSPSTFLQAETRTAPGPRLAVGAFPPRGNGARGRVPLPLAAARRLAIPSPARQPLRSMDRARSVRSHLTAPTVTPSLRELVER